MKTIMEMGEALLHLIYPHVCNGCGSDIIPKDSLLCAKCIDTLPRTRFFSLTDNPLARRFYGRLPLQNTMAAYYFSKASVLQKLVHDMKYKGNDALGRQLGRMMGEDITIRPDLIVPLPLFPDRERRRGYNQSALLAEGISDHLNIPMDTSIISRPYSTQTQTKKNRMARWENMQGRFLLNDPAKIEGKHVLLVDDVITTGSTIEACGSQLLSALNVQLSVAVLCYVV